MSPAAAAPRGPVRRAPGRDELGSGTVLAAGVALALAAVTAALLVVAGYLAAADRARGTADLVAVSAAAERAGGGPGCRGAGLIAARNGARLVSCRLHGDDFDYVVAITVSEPVQARVPLLPVEVTATSHAGRLGLGGAGGG